MNEASPAYRGPLQERLDAFLEELTSVGEVTAAACSIASSQEILAEAFAGDAAEPEAPASSAYFDLASLTKPWMATLALCLEQDGRLALDTQMGSLWVGLPDSVARISLEDLLRHSAGFRPWLPLYKLCAGVDDVLETTLAEGPFGASAGTYSDLDYIVWGFALEKIVGLSLAELIADYLPFEGLASDRSAVGGTLLPCYLDNGKEVELAGLQGVRVELLAGPEAMVPQDGNARFLGGLAGHAGLFGTLDAMLELGRSWCGEEGWHREVGGWFEGTDLGKSMFGWRPVGSTPTAGCLGPRSFGHMGFTGGSLWIDPDVDRILVLLGHRRSSTFSMEPWRRRFHQLLSA